MREVDAANLTRKSARKFWPGCYRAKVESIDDPDRLGRVKARVWAVHGDDQRTPTTALPWATVSYAGGGGYDFGELDPPPVGSGVLVMFEEADDDFPVVLGTFHGVPIRDDENPNVFLVKDNQPANETAWDPPDEGLETPKDVFEDVYDGDPHPTRRVWKKSYKGHTFVVEDGDGVEFVRIIDRSGQVLEFDCAVDEDNAAGNAAQRGIRTSIKGDQLPYSAMKNRRASIRLRDLGGQEILLDARDQDERVVIRSKGRGSGSENKITLRSGKTQSGITIEDTAGNQIVLDPLSRNPIKLEDSIGNAILFDKEEGTVQIKSAKGADDDHPRKNTLVRGAKTDDIRGDEDKRVLGNKKTRVINDSEFSVLGNSQVTVGGALKFVLTNSSPAGPEVINPAMDILLANLAGADFALTNQQGDITLETYVGDVNVNTLVGNLNLTSLAGISNLDASVSVLLGNKLTAPANPVLKGTVHNSLMSTYLTALTAARGTYAGLATAFEAGLIPGIVLNAIPAIGNTLFSAIVGVPLWVPYQSGVIALNSEILAAEAALATELVTALSTKVFTE